ncbi:MAG TPA: contractile injection system protein, VgrG/Pvc8 family, partial [Acetobacteraceae bacterium]
MVKKFLTLDTEKGGDVLKPAQLTGEEGLSMPFRYELTMCSSSRDIEDMFNSPASSLIGTMARIGILTGPDDTDYTYRTGMFARFEKSGTFNPGGVQDNLSMYRATLVPAVQMLGRQQAFRVFENQNVVSIIKALLSDMQGRFPDFQF